MATHVEILHDGYGHPIQWTTVGTDGHRREAYQAVESVLLAPVPEHLFATFYFGRPPAPPFRVTVRFDKDLRLANAYKSTPSAVEIPIESKNAQEFINNTMLRSVLDEDTNRLAVWISARTPDCC